MAFYYLLYASIIIAAEVILNAFLGALLFGTITLCGSIAVAQYMGVEPELASRFPTNPSWADYAIIGITLLSMYAGVLYGLSLPVLG